MKYFFTADEHYSHENILKYCNRPFDTVEEMDNEIIKRHNEVVSDEDIVYHLGDFTLKNTDIAKRYIERLNGNHIFVIGGHDYWITAGSCQSIIEREIEGEYIVMCHYPMISWPRSFHGSIQLFGHVHGGMNNLKNQLDVGVDNNNFYPFSFEDVLNNIKKD